MKIKLVFLGAAQNVTGSSYLLEIDGTRLLVDCGLSHERAVQGRNWQDFPVTAGSLQSILLTHAHLDHSGLLPKLVRDGFRGKIYCTEPTAEIVQIMLLDSAKLQEEDAQTKRRRHEKEGRRGPHPEGPLYTTEVQGFDVAAEGPFTKKHKSSYLFNYRYSILAFLKYIDPSLKNSLPEFQDLSFKINIPAGKAGNFSLLGIGGMSGIRSVPEEDPADWKTLDDRAKSDLNNKMGAMALIHLVYLSRNSYLRSAVSVTYNDILFNENQMVAPDTMKPKKRRAGRRFLFAPTPSPASDLCLSLGGAEPGHDTHSLLRGGDHRPARLLARLPAHIIQPGGHAGRILLPGHSRHCPKPDGSPRP